MPLPVGVFALVLTGVAVGVWLPAEAAVVAPVSMAAAGAAAVMARAAARAALARLAAAAALCGVAVLLGASAETRARYPPLRDLAEHRLGGLSIEDAAARRIEAPVPIEGRLVEDGALTEWGAVLRVDVRRVRIGEAWERARGGVLLSVSGTLAAERVREWRAGRRVRVPALLRRPARYLNPGVPDQERALARRGVALVGAVKSAALVEVVGRGGWLDEHAAAVRWRVRDAIGRHVSARDPRAGAIATAILIGDRAGLDAEVERRLQEAGTYHVIAISGGNVAILAGLVLVGLRWAGASPRAAAAAAIAVLAWFAFVAGGGASVGRATVMAVVYLALRLIDQRTSPAHVIAIAGAALLVVSPLSVADVGFWLTFGATAGIVAAARVPLPAWPPGRALAALVLASAAAEAALMPLGARVFQRVTVAGLALNLVAVPCMGVVQVAAMVTVAAAWAGLDAAAWAAGWATHQAAALLAGSAALVDLAPWSTWRVPPPRAWAMAAYYGALLVCGVGASRRTTRAWREAASRAAWLAAALFAWIAVDPPTLVRRHGDGRLHLTAIDVGQGDALLATLPNGRTLLVDAGGVTVRGDFDVGDRVVGPALRARGLRRIDYLAITHADPDHIGGASAVARDLDPTEVWIGVPVVDHEATTRLRLAADTRGAAWRTLQRGDRVELGGVELRVLHPPPPDWERRRPRNDDSLVIELRLGRVSILLAGDIERETEQALAPSLDLLPVVVLKAAHHGSGTSSTAAFVAAAHPALVVVSAGRGNPYGHPVPYVVDRFRREGAAVYRTDLDGQIEVVTDGRTVAAESFTGRRWAGPR